MMLSTAHDNWRPGARGSVSGEVFLSLSLSSVYDLIIAYIFSHECCFSIYLSHPIYIFQMLGRESIEFDRCCRCRLFTVNGSLAF